MELEYESKAKELTFRILTWNLRSINNLSKVKRLLDERPDIAFLQEVWKENIFLILKLLIVHRF